MCHVSVSVSVCVSVCVCVCVQVCVRVFGCTSIWVGSLYVFACMSAHVFEWVGGSG